MKENNIIQQKNKKSNEKYRIKNESKTTSTSTTTTTHTKKKRIRFCVCMKLIHNKPNKLVKRWRNAGLFIPLLQPRMYASNIFRLEFHWDH